MASLLQPLLKYDENVERERVCDVLKEAPELQPIVKSSCSQLAEINLKMG